MTGVASFSQAAAIPTYGLLHLVVDLQFLRVAEVQAVGKGNRLGAGADDVARRFRHSNCPAGVGVEVAVETVAVIGQGDALLGALDAH